MPLTPEDLTIFKSTNDGVYSALGFPLNSCLLKNNMPLMFGGGGGKKKKQGQGMQKGREKEKDKIIDYLHDDVAETEAASFADVDATHLAVPAGLLCMRATIALTPSATDENMDMDVPYNLNENLDDFMSGNRPDGDVIPDDLYEKLLRLAMTNAAVAKRLTKRKNNRGSTAKSNSNSNSNSNSKSKKREKHKTRKYGKK